MILAFMILEKSWRWCCGRKREKREDGVYIDIRVGAENACDVHWSTHWSSRPPSTRKKYKQVRRLQQHKDMQSRWPNVDVGSRVFGFSLWLQGKGRGWSVAVPLCLRNWETAWDYVLAWVEVYINLLLICRFFSSNYYVLAFKFQKFENIAPWLSSLPRPAFPKSHILGFNVFATISLKRNLGQPHGLKTARQSILTFSVFSSKKHTLTNQYVCISLFKNMSKMWDESWNNDIYLHLSRSSFPKFRLAHVLAFFLLKS